MPWFPIKGIVRKLRLERGLTRMELAKRAGVKPRTVRLWESDRMPRTGHDDTVRGFAAALTVAPEAIADWLDYDPDLDDLDDAPGGAPSKSTLATRAARDEVRECIALPSGEKLELIRPRLLHRIKTAPGLCADKRYAIAGKVRDHRDMPPVVGTALSVNSIVCGQFLLARRIQNGDVCYASPFTAAAEHTRRLLDANDRRENVTAVVRVAIKEPDDDFKGFFFFQKRGDKPKANKWCFVIEQVLDGEIPVHYGEMDRTIEEIEIKPTVRRRAKMPRSRAKSATADE